MADFFQRFIRRYRPGRAPAIPPGSRVYAVGDIHGRLDLFDALADAIEEDDAKRTPADTTIVLLGDLIDRGPHSAEVVSRAQAWSERRKVRFISGNHEEMFLLSFYKLSALKTFLRYGGRETLASYGLNPDLFGITPFIEAQTILADAVPREHREFLRSFETTISIGDYLFVHAGIKPNVPLTEQNPHDCRWIREPFLSHGADFGRFVVHGHTVTESVDLRSNRIGIDTGAFMSNTLTALCLEGTGKRLIQTEQNRDGVRTFASTIGVRERAHALPGSL